MFKELHVHRLRISFRFIFSAIWIHRLHIILYTQHVSHRNKGFKVKSVSEQLESTRLHGIEQQIWSKL